MTVAKAIEYRIIRQLTARPLASAPPEGLRQGVWIDRLIGVLAATAGLFVLGAVLQELLWVAIAAALIVALASPGKTK